MPYIKNRIRAQYNGYLRHITNMLIREKNPNAVMTYVIYKLIKTLYDKPSWDIKSDALKILEAVKIEFYRKCMAEYEDEKIVENGDI